MNCGRFFIFYLYFNMVGMNPGLNAAELYASWTFVQNPEKKQTNWHVAALQAGISDICSLCYMWGNQTVVGWKCGPSIFRAPLRQKARHVKRAAEWDHSACLFCTWRAKKRRGKKSQWWATKKSSSLKIQKNHRCDIKVMTSTFFLTQFPELGRKAVRTETSVTVA